MDVEFEQLRERDIVVLLKEDGGRVSYLSGGTILRALSSAVPLEDIPDDYAIRTKPALFVKGPKWRSRAPDYFVPCLSRLLMERCDEK